jgi:hypothetical protein
MSDVSGDCDDSDESEEEAEQKGVVMTTKNALSSSA